ncbi:hypothetical protein [Aminivibrio sp.]|uniref:hypothetical protein n=1 Tax=Aminivibrio sp. TaxID=1872489 RepID=UPI003D956458
MTVSACPFMPGLSEAISIEGSDGLKDAAGADPPRKKSRKKKAAAMRNNLIC